MSLKNLIFNCLRPSSTQSPKPTIRATKQVSVRRLVLSDSTVSVSDLSSSLMIGTNLYVFTLEELQVITHGFSKVNYLGEGGFGPVFKGFVDDRVRPGLEARVVAVKRLDLNGSQGDREWLAEVIFLGELKHPHLVNLIGYCCEDVHRLLVYEYLERGNLEDQLFGRLTATLPWRTRLKIAVGAAKGLAFLHQEEKPVIYRDFKASNVLLDADFNARVSDFGLATDGPDGDDPHVSTRIMGTKGYADPEYIMTGHLTTMSDVYSFGIVLLELLTGRRAVEKICLARKLTLVEWARPMLKDHNKLDLLMDPNLEGQYSSQGAKRAALMAYRCLSRSPKSRPSMSDVVKVLEPLVDLNHDIPVGPFVYIVPSETKDECGDLKAKEEERKRHWNGDQSWLRHRFGSRRDGTVHSDSALDGILGGRL